MVPPKVLGFLILAGNSRVGTVGAERQKGRTYDAIVTGDKKDTRRPGGRQRLAAALAAEHG